MKKVFLFLMFPAFLYAQGTEKAPNHPQQTTTGNVQVDEANWLKAKKEWISNYPEEYQAMEQATKAAAVLTPVTQAIPSEITENIPQENATAPHYPVKTMTGDLQQDEKNWIKSKNEWIANYPEEYISMGGIIPPPTKAVPEKKLVPERILPIFETAKTYRLQQVEAVPVAGYSVTAEMVAIETAKVQKKFPIHSTEFQLGKENQIRLFHAQKMDLRALEKRNGSEVEWFFENEKCASCSKTLFLTLEKETAEELIYLMKDEDEGSQLDYRFIFVTVLNKD